MWLDIWHEKWQTVAGKGNMSMSSEQQRLVEFIRRRGGSVTLREVTQSYWPLKNRRENSEARLNELVTNRCAQWDEIKTSPKGGRPTRKLRLLPREIPLIYPPEEGRPQPYSVWANEDRREFGIGSPRTQWQFFKRISNGMTTKQAAEDMGLPLAGVQRFIYRNAAFRERIEQAHEWAARKSPAAYET